MSKAQLSELENEAIFILREAYSGFGNPVLLYSIGKDSSVLLHLCRKAFYPLGVPFQVLHIDTGYKFKEMIEFRDKIARQHNLDLLVYSHNGDEEVPSPFENPNIYTDIMKTKALRDALDKFGFDAAIGGARRDEEKSRAKERIFSVRNQYHNWDPKLQRPELWKNFNTQLKNGEKMRVFPLSNWTELEIWQYIRRENIEIVPLYFAKEREFVRRKGQLIMRDDHRLVAKNDEKFEVLNARFRTLGCYPLTAAIESNASNIDEIICEIVESAYSERVGRLIDNQIGTNMEQKKREGYF